jgi:hypothetical protein
MWITKVMRTLGNSEKAHVLLSGEHIAIFKLMMKFGAKTLNQGQVFDVAGIWWKR